ncbi:MAG: NUMOD3 domain-containing DNA-binding protein, partial [Ktedonobacteraceae bacterium]
LKPFNDKGFNIAPIAGSRLGIKVSAETLDRMRMANLGKKRGEETKRKIAEAIKGKAKSPEAIEKYSIARRGHSVSMETRIKISDAFADRMKTIIVTAPDGSEYTVIGIKRFCREHGLSSGSLLYVIQGKYSQHKGWKARYTD